MPQNTQQPGSARRFLITGAKGFIGAWIVKNLIERGDAPYIFDLDTASHRLSALLNSEQMSRLRFVRGDVVRFEHVDKTVAEHGITHVIHLAALQVPACAADPGRGAQVNVLGTLNVFEVARRRRDLVQRIVYASSAAVFGPEEFYGSDRVPEGAALRPGTHYGVFKQTNEGNARVYFASDGIASVGLRPWAVYGVGRDQGITSGPTKAIKACVVGRPYTIRFTGGLDLQYVDDTAKIFLRAAESDSPGARVYTLRGSVAQVNQFIRELEHIRPASHGLIRAEGKPLPIAYDLDDSALVHDLGDVPRTPLESGIRQTLEVFERLQREGRLDRRDLEE
ncbi:MAG TPA: NAD(P)-dependent oxidoreductase [Terriglobia bacterium]|nr:NAD(P)-dependent oxidoreductase [Terriglobia bacterium]